MYSVNPDLNHDKCMTLLAAAGIYLVLDVNSPLVGQHLNRYEPWTTYTDKYVSHIFQVVNEFGGYNNTLAFFAGNEIINDKISATNSPVYVKAVIRDMKMFIKENGIRSIPVGYSAADDLAYRTSLAEYLECYETDPMETLDFYGVNTYQWCGEQTFYTSGYNHLVRDYSSYSKPIFFSEYGCNEVVPRIFKEVGAIYSSQMTNVFCGGLVYEFAQEPNNYGLIDYDEHGNVKLLPDFFTFKDEMSKVKDVKFSKKLALQNQQAAAGKMSRKNGPGRKICELQYQNLDISKGIPRSMGVSIVRSFANKPKGKFVALTQDDMVANYKVFSPDGSLLHDKLVVKAVPEPTANPNDAISCEYCLEDDERELMDHPQTTDQPLNSVTVVPVPSTGVENDNGKSEDRTRGNEINNDRKEESEPETENKIEKNPSKTKDIKRIKESEKEKASNKKKKLKNTKAKKNKKPKTRKARAKTRTKRLKLDPKLTSNINSKTNKLGPRVRPKDQLILKSRAKERALTKKPLHNLPISNSTITAKALQKLYSSTSA